MDEQALFTHLKREKKDVLIEYLREAFRAMDAEQRDDVFGDALPKTKPTAVSGDELLAEIQKFHADSVARRYYAPFNMNSKNFMHIPEKTREWCNNFARFAESATKLTERGEHSQAVECFALLCNVLAKMEYGEEIIFAEEAGCWLIPTEEKTWLTAYLHSLAAIATPEEYAAAAVPLLKRDNSHSSVNRLHAAANKAATPQQRKHLNEEIKRQGIRTPDS
jgi:hypothetical protein